MSSTKRGAGKSKTVAPGVYLRNGTYIVMVWNPSKGEKGGKDYHTLGRCACGRTHPGSTKTDAINLKADLEREKRGRAKLKAEMTVGEWIGHYTTGDGRGAVDWVRGKWLGTYPRRAKSTNLHYDERMRPFSRKFAERPLGSITAEEAQDFATEHPASVKEVSTAFADALKKGLILDSPFERVGRPRSEGRSKITVLKDAELEQLIETARVALQDYGREYAAMIQTAAWTGLRPGELYVLSLTPGDQVNFVDFDAETIYVDWQLQSRTGTITRPKNGTQREVILLPKAAEALRSMPVREGPVFRTKRGAVFSQRAQHYYWNQVRSAFVAMLPPGHQLRQRMIEGANGPGGDGNFDYYELRHFFGTKLAHPPAGVPAASPYEIAAMMGHADGGQLALSRYVHIKADVAQRSIRDAWRKAS